METGEIAIYEKFVARMEKDIQKPTISLESRRNIQKALDLIKKAIEKEKNKYGIYPKPENKGLGYSVRHSSEGEMPD